jgi:hypothetical protein
VLLKGQPFSHCCCCLLLAARTRHDTHVTHVTFAICWENVTLHYRARIVTTCHFVPKILTIKEWVHFFFGPLCTYVKSFTIYNY